MKKVRVQTGRWVFPVHRLDSPVSGIVLFAFGPEAARHLAHQFRSHSVDKIYLAVTRGYVDRQGCIDSPLTRNPYAPKAGQAQVAALTRYERLNTIELNASVGRYATSRYSLVAVYPRSGRMHQIRRHFSHIRHPLICDTTYGDGRHNRFFRETFGCRHILLAAVELRLQHPRDGTPLHLVAPLAKNIQDVLHQIGWIDPLPHRWR